MFNKYKLKGLEYLKNKNDTELFVKYKNMNINDYENWMKLHRSIIRLKLRYNILIINEYLMKQNFSDNNKYNMCNDNRIEDYYHLLFECKYYRLIRREFNDKLNQISNWNKYNRNMKLLLFK